MNRRIALLAVLGLFVLGMGVATVAGGVFMLHQLQAAEARAHEAELHAEDLARQIEVLKENEKLAQERGRELAVLQNRNAELEKEIAAKKSSLDANNFTMAVGNNGNVLHWQIGNAGQPQLETVRLFDAATGRLQGAEVKLPNGAVLFNGVGDAQLNVLQGDVLKLIDDNVQVLGAQPAPDPNNNAKEAKQTLERVKVLIDNFQQEVPAPKKPDPAPKAPAKEEF